MGYRTIFLILAFLIIFGSIIIVLVDKQINAIEGLSASKLKKEAQQIANSYVLDATRELKQRLSSGQGIMPPLATTQGIYSIDLQVYDTTYDTQTLPDNYYYIVCRVEVTDEDGTTYRFGTNAMYEYDSGGVATSPWIPAVMGLNSSYPLSLALQADGFSFWQQAQGSTQQGFFQYYTPSGPSAGLEKLSQQISGIPNFSNVIYIPSSLVSPLGYLRIANHTNGTGGTNPITLDYDITIIVEGNIRIDGALLVNPPHKINLVAIGSTIYTNAGGNNNPGGDIRADLYKGPSALAINIETNRGYTHNLPFRKLVTNGVDFDTVWTDLESNGSVNISAPEISSLRSWEEMPVEKL